ncbi:hypothetical protein C8A05DRAFT_12613, partial [Staphylotrichum tortipilum]
ILSGGFILFCFIAWMAWRTMKKPRRNGGSGSGFGRSLRGLASKIPFLKQRAWQNLDDSASSRSPPPSYREKGGGSAPSLEGFFASEKMQTQQPPLQQPQQQLVQQPLPQPLQSHPMQPSWPLGPLDNNMYQQPLANPPNTYSPDSRPSITVVTNIPVYTHQPQESFSSTNAAHFGAILGGNPTSASPLQNGISPLSLYNQPFQTQQYGPYNSQLYRQPSQALSEVSSLSSGFGDGEMMPAGSVVSPPAPTATLPGSSSTSPGGQYTARFSWMSQARTAGGGLGRQNSSGSRSGRRETVYTESSEDQPARFRSVTSWVDQQTGRIRRAQQRGDGDGGSTAAAQVPGHPGIPGIHNPPGEPSFGMMMDDEEMPRRVEEVVAGLGVGVGGQGVGRG